MIESARVRLAYIKGQVLDSVRHWLTHKSHSLLKRVDADLNGPISPSLKDLVKLEPALVIDEEGVVASKNVIELYLRAILSGDTFKDLRAELAADPQKAFPSRPKEIASYLRSQIPRTRWSKDVENSAVQKALALVDLHEEQSDTNRVSYVSPNLEVRRRQYWPDLTDTKDPHDLSDVSPVGVRKPLITKTTPIGSAGSCFAFEIAHRLQTEGFNYIVTEPNSASGDKTLSDSCARWGTIFNTPSFKQLIERCLDGRQLPPIVWSTKKQNKTLYMDPFREDVGFESLKEYEADQVVHIARARQALLKCKVFVITLGVNEVWFLKGHDVAFSRAPWKIAAELTDRRVLTVEENLKYLEDMLRIWRGHNPDLQLIVSVSPVPLHATFRSADTHIVTANTHSKSTLRVVAEEFCRRNAGVFYLPSYEQVMYCTKDPWQKDLRHVSREAVQGVMALFDKMFVQ